MSDEHHADDGGQRSYDLGKHTARFGEQVIRLVRRMPLDVINSTLVKQLVRSSAGIGANDAEAVEAGSKKGLLTRIAASFTRRVNELMA